LPHDQNTSLHPIIRLLEGLLGFQAVDSLEVRREKLVGMLAWHQLNQPSAVWLLSLLLGLPTEAPSPETITKAQREQMRQLYIALLQKRAAEQPVVLVIEDLHWSDPSTVEWIGHSLTSLASVPCLTLLTARPGFNPAWLVQRDSQRNLLILTILPLQPEQAEEMMFDLAGGSMLDEGVRRRVVAQTDGIPLFVEELTKTLLEQPALRGKGSKSTEIPATLMDSLAARLDHLGWAKETAQWAAVLGREFSYPILQACIPYDEGRLQSDLARLVEAELVSPLQIVPREMTSPHSRVSKMAAPAHYAFKHALMHEAAYVSLLKGTRQAYHRRIAEMLEARFPQLAEARPELLAQHYSNAGMQPQAVDLWLRACEHATALGATLEAKDFYDLALEALDAGDHERRWQALEGRERVFDLRVEREAQQHDITALRELAETSDNDTWRAQAWLRQMRYDLHCSDFLAACRAADAAIEIAGRVGNRALKAQALAGKVHALIDVEDRAAALQAAEETLAELREVADNTVQAYALSEVALYFHNVGDLSRAMLLMQRAMQAAQREGNRRRESTIHVNLGVIYIQLGLYLQARDTLEKGLVLAEAIGERGLPVPLTDNLGYVYWSRGDRDRAIALGEQALRENRNMGGSPYNEAGILAGLGLYLESAGEWAAAIEHFTEARAIFARLGMNAEGLEAQVVEARARLALGQPEEARQLASDAWKHLHKHGSAGIFYPARVYVCVADIVHAIEIPGLSVREVIEAGYHDLMQRAGKISDIEWRRSFVENVAENRAIVERWKAK
jgi:predicted ATPase